MNNILSYFGLVDARISASEKDLPVIPKVFTVMFHDFFDVCLSQTFKSINFFNL